MKTFKERISDPKSSYARRLIYKETAVMLVGYCDDTLDNFKTMVEVARKSFPDLKDEEVTCSKVRKSSSVQGFTVIIFPVTVKEAEGWTYIDHGIDFYF